MCVCVCVCATVCQSEAIISTFRLMLYSEFLTVIVGETSKNFRCATEGSFTATATCWLYFALNTQHGQMSLATPLLLNTSQSFLYISLPVIITVADRRLYLLSINQSINQSMHLYQEQAHDTDRQIYRQKLLKNNTRKYDALQCSIPIKIKTVCFCL